MTRTQRQIRRRRGSRGATRLAALLLLLVACCASSCAGPLFRSERPFSPRPLGPTFVTPPGPPVVRGNPQPVYPRSVAPAPFNGGPAPSAPAPFNGGPVPNGNPHPGVPTPAAPAPFNGGPVPNGNGTRGMPTPTPASGTQITVNPAELIAPVGSQVVLMASVYRGGRLAAGERVQWRVAENSVGRFVEAGGQGGLLGRGGPRVINEKAAVGTTQTQDITIRPRQKENGRTVRRGQAWVTVTSRNEGVSQVTAHWARAGGRQTAVIHWVDAQWVLPSPAISPVGGRQTISTSVMRQTDNSPRSGWLVRYEISGRPDAVFAPGGNRTVEVATDASGQAQAQIVQQRPSPGNNTIRVQVVRPASAGERRLVIGQGSTQCTWSAGVWLRMNGPERASAGETVKYQMEVANPGGGAERGLSAVAIVPPGLSLVDATPRARQEENGQLRWELGEMASGNRQQIEANFRVLATAPEAELRMEVHSNEGVLARESVTTAIARPVIQVSVRAEKNQADVGRPVKFIIDVANTGDLTAGGLLVTCTFDKGLAHDVAASPIERDLESLAPGAKTTIGLTLTVNRSGEFCNTVKVSGDHGAVHEAQACVTGLAPPKAKVPRVTLRLRSPGTMTAGKPDVLEFELTNHGDVPLTGLVVVARFDAVLEPVRASEPFKFSEEGGPHLTWRIDRLEVGKAMRLQAECQGKAAARRACARVTVTTEQAAGDEGQACLEITRP